MIDKFRSFFAWSWGVLARVDVALMLAAAVEIPRWTVTFLAIHEPLWVGVPLGALLAYAASEGWKAYFADKRRYVLLTFNVASLLAATFVITPVLYSMATGPIESLDLTRVLPPVWLATWAGVLAVTTFAPLIQLAAVKAVQPHAATPPHALDVAVQQPAATPIAEPHTVRGTMQPSALDVALQMAGEGCSVAQIAAQVDAKPATVRSWIARARASARARQNGVHHA